GGTESNKSRSEGSSKPRAPKQASSPSAYDKEKGKCIRCLEPGHSWKDCKARIPPASEQTSGGGSHGQDNGGETVCCPAKSMLGTMDNSCTQERSDGISEKWIADSGASFRMTHSADFLSDVRLCDDKVRIGDNHLIDVVGYGTL
ncbi:unnamed protein product, partial [Laminaria digitata]